MCIHASYFSEVDGRAVDIYLGFMSFGFKPELPSNQKIKGLQASPDQYIDLEKALPLGVHVVGVILHSTLNSILPLFELLPFCSSLFQLSFSAALPFFKS